MYCSSDSPAVLPVAPGASAGVADRPSAEDPPSHTEPSSSPSAMVAMASAGPPPPPLPGLALRTRFAGLPSEELDSVSAEYWLMSSSSSRIAVSVSRSTASRPPYSPMSSSTCPTSSGITDEQEMQQQIGKAEGRK